MPLGTARREGVFINSVGRRSVGKLVGYRHDGVNIEDLDALDKYRQDCSSVITGSSNNSHGRLQCRFKHFTSHEACEAYKEICLWDRPEVTCNDLGHLRSLYMENSVL